jgi:hypothetical protein
LTSEHQAWANKIRGYTIKVRAGGLQKNQRFQTRVGGFCLYSCDL